MTLESIITCPACRTRSAEVMPTDSCLVMFQCPGCATELHPKPGDCCVFCSYGDAKCPSRTTSDETHQ